MKRWVTILAGVMCCAWAEGGTPKKMIGSTMGPSPEVMEAARRAQEGRRILDKNRPAQNVVVRCQTEKTVEATLALAIDTAQFQAGEWVICAPYPPDWAGQRLLGYQMTPAARIVTDSSVPFGKVLYATAGSGMSAGGHDAEMVIKYRLQLVRRDLELSEGGGKESGMEVPRPKKGAVATVGALTSDERAAYLSPNGGIDFDSPVFQKWLDKNQLRPAKEDSELSFARRAFLAIAANCTYQYPSPTGQISKNCVFNKGDCGGLSGIFCGVMRAAGMPARMIIGRWASTADRTEDDPTVLNIGQCHCKAEFYLTGTGWVPVDMSGGVGLATNHHDALACFGHQGANFVTMTFDSEMEVNTPFWGKQRLGGMQGFRWWVNGSGSLEKVKEIPIWQVVDLSEHPATKPARTRTGGVEG